MKKIYLIAAVIALAAGVATYFFANELKTSKIVTGVDEATVLIAVDDIDEDTVLTKEMFQEVKLPVTAVSFGTVCNISDIIGCMTTDRILAGEQLMARKIVPVGEETGQSGGRLSYELANGMYAYTISVGIENGVSYFIKENDMVNIYDENSPSAEPILKNVPVLKVSDYASNKQQDSGAEIISYSVLTLALTKEQIPKLMQVENPDGSVDNTYRIVLVSHIEGHSLADDIAKASVPEERNLVPQTNYGMGEITTSPPVTE
ncbi:MAG: Flp pilus assembly protein CpaB [Clostridia bacterium]|nr:Flp pilus assembly protein CpaB [Clostridia bacterium]